MGIGRVGDYKNGAFVVAATPDVVEYAVTYLRCRCVASPAVLSFFVAIGSFRGFRDTMYASHLIHSSLTYSLDFHLKEHKLRNVEQCCKFPATGLHF